MNKDESYFEALLEQAKAGKPLAKDDLKLVRDELQAATTGADPYTLLHILGKANDRVALPIIWTFVNSGIDDSADDGMIRRIAVQILAQWWLLKEAFPLVLEKAFEDPSPFVRAIAASSIGQLAKAYPELELEAARALLRGIGSHGKEQRDVWGAFYESMMELMGVDWRERPTNPGDLNPRDLDPVVLEGIQRIARKE